MPGTLTLVQIAVADGILAPASRDTVATIPLPRTIRVGFRPGPVDDGPVDSHIVELPTR